jgi:hypothetical protein
MRRKLIVGAVALLGVTGAATMATTVFGGGSEPRASYAETQLKLQPEPKSQRAKKGKKPTLVYLTGGPSPVDSAALGPYIDIRLASCPNNARVVEGGIVADDLEVVLQGSYVGENRREYHVLIADNPSALGPFNITSHLTCLKGKSRG